MNSGKIKKTGIVVAIEIDSVLSRYGTPSETVITHGRTVRTYKNEEFELYVIDSGAGEISAASGAQLLISEFNVDMIVNFGVVGALTEEMASSELCIVEKLIHYDFDTTGWLNLKRGQYPNHESEYLTLSPDLIEKATAVYPGLKKVVCASADKFIDRAEDKIALHEAYGADICEMEAAGIALTCELAGVPCLIIKAVADSLTGGGAEFLTELEKASDICFGVVDKVIRAI